MQEGNSPQSFTVVSGVALMHIKISQELKLTNCSVLCERESAVSSSPHPFHLFLPFHRFFIYFSSVLVCHLFPAVCRLLLPSDLLISRLIFLVGSSDLALSRQFTSLPRFPPVMRVCLVLIKRRVTSFPGFRTYWSRDSSFVLGDHLLACRLHNEAFVVTDLTHRRSRPFFSQCPTVVPVAVETIRNRRKRSVI